MFHNFRHKKMQTVIIFLIITLAVLLLNGSVCVLKSLDKPMREFGKECESSDVQAYPYYEDEQSQLEMKQNLESLSSVERVTRVKNISLADGIDHNGEHSNPYCVLAEYEDTVYGKAHVVKGNFDVSSYKENECAIPACVSNEYDVALGDTVNVLVDGQRKDYKVMAIYSDIYDMSTAYDSRILVNKLPVAKKYGSVFYIDLSNATLDDVVEQYREKFGDFPMNVHSIDEMIDSNLISAHITGSIFLAIGIIMLFVSIVIIYFIVRHAMLADAKKVAIYKTIGYTYREIIFLYLRFYATIVGIAAAIGIVLSKLLATKLLDKMFQNMGKEAKVPLLFPGVITFAAATVLVLAIINLVLQKMKNVKPVYVLSGLSNRNTRKHREYKGNLEVAFSPAGIALRNFLRNKRGAFGILLTSIVTVFAINFAMISIDIANSMEKENTYWFSFDPSDFVITVPDQAALDEATEALRNCKDVEKFNQNTLNNQSKMLVEYQKGLNNTVLYPFVYETYEGLNIPLIEGRNPKNEKEIALATVMADRLHKKVGDYIRVSLDADTTLDLLITGTFQTYVNLGESARVTGDVYTKNHVEFCYNTISVYIKDGADRDQVMNELKGKVSSGDIFKYREDCFESIMDLIAAPQKVGIPPVMILVLVISAINIFSIVLLKNAANKKTNQIYKSIGYSTRDLVMSNLIYVGMIALVAIVVAVPALIALYPKIMMVSLSLFSMREYPMHVNYLHIFVANAVVLGMFLLSTGLSSKSIKKLDVRELVVD